MEEDEGLGPSRLRQLDPSAEHPDAWESRKVRVDQRVSKFDGKWMLRLDWSTLRCLEQSVGCGSDDQLAEECGFECLDGGQEVEELVDDRLRNRESHRRCHHLVQ